MGESFWIPSPERRVHCAHTSLHLHTIRYTFCNCVHFRRIGIMKSFGALPVPTMIVIIHVTIIVIKSLLICVHCISVYWNCSYIPELAKWQRLLQHYKLICILSTHLMELVFLMHMQSMATPALLAMLSGLGSGVNFRYIFPILLRFTCLLFC